MQHVHTALRIPSRLARLARQLDRPHGEEAAAGAGVFQFDQTSVKIDLRRQRRNRHQRRRADAQNRRDAAHKVKVKRQTSFFT